jgi:hypothetical protein
MSVTDGAKLCPVEHRGLSEQIHVSLTAQSTESDRRET